MGIFQFLKSKLDPDSQRKKLLEESDVFCMAPWVHLHMAPQGQIFPCCISAHYLEEAIGKLDRQTSIEEIWNSERTKALRFSMLNGQKIKLCELCYQYQDIGKKSPRDDFNEQFAKDFDRIKDTNEDGSYDHFSLKYIDFRFSNLCNFKCRICSHHFSTRWYDDAKSLGMVSKDKERLIIPIDDAELLWSQIEPILPHLEKIHFAGGEPLIMEEHYRILNFFLERGMNKVRITYNTNFSETKYKSFDAIDMWKHFKHVSVSASLDGMGERGEFMRKGQDWHQVEDNRKRMLKECPHVDFQITPAISVMNVLHFPDFYKNWVDRKMIQAKQVNLYLVFEPDFYNILHLPDSLKKQVNEKYQDFFNTYLQKMDQSSRTYVQEQFNMILNHMNKETGFAPNRYYHNHTFYSFNQKLDELREENFIATFPELKELMIPEVKTNS